MYEEKTYENIMADMMADVPDGVDTSEGSLIYNSCAKCAMALEEFYGNLGDVYDNIEVDTQDLDHLIDGGAESGCPIIEATAATLSAQFNIALDAATRLEAPDTALTYYILECTDATNHIYTIESEDPGTEANSYIGEVEPIEYVDGFENGVILSLLTAGEDQEDEEVYRRRRLDYYQTRPFAGNRAYYVDQITAIEGVGGCKVNRVSAAGGTISAVIIASDYTVPAATLVQSVQNSVDPNSGDGEGIAPICAKVAVSAISAIMLNISGTLTLASGISYADIKTAVETAIDKCLTEINKTWASTDTNLVVRLSQIELALIGVEQIIDVQDLKINNSVSNCELLENVIAKRGDLTWS